MKLLVLLFISCSTLSSLAQTNCQFAAQVTSANCNNQKGRIEMLVANGMPPFQYQWSAEANTKNSAVARGLSSGTYSVTILDAAACVFVDTITVEQVTNFSVSGELLASECNANTGNVRLLLDEVDPNATYFYSINGLSYHFENHFYDVPPGEYTLYAKIDNDCVDSTRFTIPVPETLDIDLGGDYLVSLGDSLKLVSYAEDTFVDFQWSPATGLSCTDCPQPTVAITQDTEFTLTVTDSTGCTASDAVRVLVQKDRNIYIPTAFSPNNDGVNDEFYIFAGEGVVELQDFRIYGRWGNLVHQVEGTFAANDYRLAWNGNMVNRPVAAGEYVYQFTAVFLDGAEILYQGIVKLVR